MHVYVCVYIYTYVFFIFVTIYIITDSFILYLVLLIRRYMVFQSFYRDSYFLKLLVCMLSLF